jgi:GAF domain-containing protein
VGGDNSAGRDGSGPGRDRLAAESSRESADLVASLHALSVLANAELPLEPMLTKVAEYAVQAIPGAEGAGLTLIAEDMSETLVATTPFVSQVDAIQYKIRQGPCLSSASDGVTVLSRSLGEDRRWPEFARQVVALGVHSALSLPLLSPERVVGTMNIYARRRDAFDTRSAALGETYAIPAAIAVQNSQVLTRARQLTTQLEKALATRAVIDRAIGVLIGRDGLSTEDAEHRLRATSRAEGVTMRQGAEAVLRRVQRGDGR